MERQMSHSSVMPRKSMSQMQRQLVTEGRAFDDSEFWGAQGREGFKTYLEKKFGSILVGWRALDKEKVGRLSFYAFCNACRAMGYHGHMKKLWDELDTSKRGHVSLMEVDPEVGHYVGVFKLHLMKKYGDMLAAWRKGIDVNGNGRIEEPEIIKAVHNLGLDLDAKKLYRFLSNKNQGMGLTLMEFDPDSWNRLVTGDVNGLTLKANMEFLEDLPEITNIEDLPKDILTHMCTSGGLKKFRKQISDAVKADSAEARAMKPGLHTLEGLRRALSARCGSLLKAWREAIDIDGNGKITFGEFCLALQRLGMFGDVKNLWKELDKEDMGKIFFKDLDPETDAAVSDLTSKLEAKYGNMLMAWVQALDVQGNGCVSENNFIKACMQAGFQGNASQMFRLMQPDKRRHFLTLKDFDTRAFNAISRGDFRMMTQQGEDKTKRPLEMNFHDRQENCFFYKIRKAWEVSKRAEFAKACRITNQQLVPEDHESFKDLCVRKYGSIMGAWRYCLDVDGCGKLAFTEITGALRRLGYAGDFKALWQELDKDKKGHITIKDLDLEADELVNSFLKMLAERFGTLDKAWKVGFGRDAHDSVDEAALKVACEAMGYAHDSQKLFRCLHPPGRMCLTIWDLDPEAARKRKQGKTAYMLDQKAPAQTSKSMDDSCSMHSTSVATMGSLTPTYGQSNLQQLRGVLKIRYGSTVAAWRMVMDPQLQGAVSFGKFCIILDDAAFNGNKKGLWEELTRGNSAVTFEDIDAEAATLLDVFRGQLLSRFGSLAAAWTAGLDVHGVSSIDETDFISRLQESSWKCKSPKKLFRLLLSHHGQRGIVFQDLQALLIGVQAECRPEVWYGRGDGSEQEAGAVPMPLSPAAARSPRDHAEQVMKEHHEQDLGICTLDGFKRLLISKYGSLFSAWRHVLDSDHNGVVTPADFARICNSLGVQGPVKIFNEIDVNKLGQISLRDMDPECCAYFASLETLLKEKFGSTRKGWKKHFDLDGSLRCDQLKFVTQCRELGLEGDAKRFFKLLRPEPGRPYLAYEDLWLNLDPNGFHEGEEPKGSSPLGASTAIRSSSVPSSPTKVGMLPRAE